ncbi:hypothetical protein [Fusobacterium massiliense]|uniref:hypothetical protein n=1 Tax=Fusobacterium massiliense TaxID=1852365 RepID=UPI00093B18D9|nr:hypothetical protein [Fusobacterium massiliense]
MILFTAEYLKNKGEAITYEFEDVEKYLQICEKYQIIETSISLTESLNILNELTADLAMFHYKELYIFFVIKEIEGIETLYIYDYADPEYVIQDSKENFAKVKSEDLVKLLLFQLGEKNEL